MLSLLPGRRYSRVLDIGCGVGVLTRQLAASADHVLGVDISQVAVDHACRLSAGRPSVQFEQADLLGLDKTLNQRFDLVVLADVVYYLAPLSDPVLKSVARVVEGLLAADGLVLLVNHDYRRLVPASRTTSQIRDAFRWAPSLQILREQWRPFYLASILQKQA